MRLLHNVLGIFFALFVIAVVAFEGNRILLSLSPPVTYVRVEALNPQVKAGGVLRVSTTLKRSRYCRAHLDQFMVRAENNTVIWRKSVPGGASELGEATVHHTHEVPATAPSGDYRLVSRGFYDCYEGMHVTNFPAVHFTVLP